MILSRTFPMRVWYVDTDQMGIAHHSNYLRYYEAARSDLMRSLGSSYADVEARGILMPILEVHSRYLAAAHFDDIINVEIILDQMPSSHIEFNYRITNEEGTLLNTGSTSLGFMHAETRRLTRCPDWFLALFDGVER